MPPADPNDIVTAATAAADAFLKVYAAPPSRARRRCEPLPSARRIAWASEARIVAGDLVRTSANFHPHYQVIAVAKDGPGSATSSTERTTSFRSTGAGRSKSVAHDVLALPSMGTTSLPFEVEPNASNHLAWMNAILGLQRTLMAAERTAVTLIAFGFTLAQVFQILGTTVPPQFLVLGPHLPRNVGS